ncbi:MAG TPA: hypothetical protein ENI15_08250 [Spirochaetes bacterium]|nr:hypothetical protein [Spirochaetota bacterium]
MNGKSSMSSSVESENFWAEKEKEKGGKVRFFTFATFIGNTGGRPATLGGLLYLIDERLYFEDFEKDNWFAKIVSSKKNYEKIELEIDSKDIEEIKTISKSTALNCIAGIIKDEDTKPVSIVTKALFQSIVQIRMKNSISYFLDIMRDKEFVAALKLDRKP